MNSEMPTTPSLPTPAISADAPDSMHVVQRHDGGGGEIGVLQLPAGLVEDFAEQHRNQLQMRSQALELRRGQRGEQMVLIRTVERWHRRIAATACLHLRGELHADAAVTDEAAGLVEHRLAAHPELSAASRRR